MDEKKVVVIRKQHIPYIINYPSDNGNKRYYFTGTKDKTLNKKPLPIEVVEWLKNETNAFTRGALIIEESEDEEIIEIKDNIPDVDKIENSTLTKNEVLEILTQGNHLSLKKKLNDLIEDQSEDVIKSIKRYVVYIASEVGIDSSSKREILANWAGIDYENSDLIFDPVLKEQYEKESQ